MSTQTHDEDRDDEPDTETGTGSDTETIKVATTVDGPTVDAPAGESVSLPVLEVLTGRAFITGKSGSGKSNTTSVVIERLLAGGHACLIADVDGEYYGLKEQYEVLQIGGDDECDIQIDTEHADKIADLALDQQEPIILDLSSYLDEAHGREVLGAIADALFAKEKKLKQPFLLVVEEIHECIPQQGAVDDVGKTLIRIGKRGRKHGLGIVGISQRPADVKKDFITQCDWLVWHRLTWNNDTKVVRRVLSADHADAVESFSDGEAFLQTDWDEQVRRVQFDRKDTYDAAARPTLDGQHDRPDMKSISDDLADELDAISAEQERRQDRIAQLEHELDQRDERIAELEQELEQAQAIGDLAERFTDAMLQQTGDEGQVQQTIEAEVMEVRQAKQEAENRVDELEAQLAQRDDRIADLEQEIDRLEAIEARVDEAEQIEARLASIEDWLADAPPAIRDAVGGTEIPDDADDEAVAALRQERDDLQAEVERLRDELETAESGPASPTSELVEMIQHDALTKPIETAIDAETLAGEHFHRVLTVLANAGGGPLTTDEIEPLADVGRSGVGKVLNELRRSGLVEKDKSGNSAAEWTLDREFIERRIEIARSE